MVLYSIILGEMETGHLGNTAINCLSNFAYSALRRVPALVYGGGNYKDLVVAHTTTFP
jgi:hypothetical protein